MDTAMTYIQYEYKNAYKNIPWASTVAMFHD